RRHRDRPQLHERGDLAGPGDLVAVIEHGDAPVTLDAEGTDGSHREPLTAHRLHRVPPQLAYAHARMVKAPIPTHRRAEPADPRPGVVEDVTALAGGAARRDADGGAVVPIRGGRS